MRLGLVFIAVGVGWLTGLWVYSLGALVIALGALAVLRRVQHRLRE